MKYTIRVYIDDGRVYEYDVEGEAKAREHCSAISEHGYRHNDGKEFEQYPAWRILKIKAVGEKAPSTAYLDRTTGT